MTQGPVIPFAVLKVYIFEIFFTYLTKYKIKINLYSFKIQYYNNEIHRQDAWHYCSRCHPFFDLGISDWFLTQSANSIFSYILHSYRAFQ